MSNSFKLCPAHFFRGGEKFCRGAKPPGYGPGFSYPVYTLQRQLENPRTTCAQKKLFRAVLGEKSGGERSVNSVY